MTTTFEIDVSEIDASFVRAIKNLFKNRRIKVTIESAIDETDYSVGHQPSREQLYKSLLEVSNNDIVYFNQQQFDELSDSLLKNSL